MPFWKRDADAPQPAAEVWVAPQVGHEQCMRHGCPQHTAIRCGYVDRRGRTCVTALCSDHHVALNGQVFCPRHAGIMHALLSSPKKGHLPEIDNRAPSLANWIGNDIDPRVRQILDYVRAKDGSETVIVEPIGYVFSVTDKAHRWERAWKLADHTGVTLKVSIDVDEALDSVVRLRVGQRDITRLIPPWVESHAGGHEPSAEQDANDRAAFYERLCQIISDSVIAYRQAQGLRGYIGSDDQQRPV